jgi:putative phosphoribosyl transferase
MLSKPKKSMRENFADRTEAGMLLAEKLSDYKNKDAIVLAIPRGGVPIGAIIASYLNAPLDLIMIKKIGHPLNEEFAIGAVSPEGRILNNISGISKEYIEQETDRLRKSLNEKYHRYTGKNQSLNIKDKTAIIVDDGIATGNTVLAAVELAKKHNPAKVIVATPVCSVSAAEKIKEKADDFVAVLVPLDLYAIGQFYENFSQTEDEEVIQLMRESAMSKRP